MNIPVGSSNAISRSDLCIQCGLDDRKMRQCIEDLRQSGEVILNMQDGNGYFVPSCEDIEQVKAAYKANRGRALSILRYNKFLKEWIKKHDTVRN